MKLGKEYRTIGGWKAVLFKEDGHFEDSYWLVKHFNQENEKKDKEWKRWFLQEDGSLKVWHKRDGSCREHNGCLSVNEERLYDLVVI